MEKVNQQTGIDSNNELMTGFKYVISAISKQAEQTKVNDEAHASSIAELSKQFGQLQNAVSEGQKLDADMVDAARRAAEEALSGFGKNLAPQLHDLWVALKSNGSGDATLSGLLDALKAAKTVRYDVAQDLSRGEKTLARTNIDAASTGDVADVNKRVDAADRAIELAHAAAADALQAASDVGDAVAVMGKGVSDSVLSTLKERGLLDEKGN